jgi:hypothetical protein
MKTKLRNYRYAWFFVLLGSFLSFTNCNSDDEDSKVQQTWLEKYDGTKWEDGNDLYWRIIDNTNKIVESWYQDGPCYIYNIADDNVNFEIIENSSDKLVFHTIEDDNINTFTLSVNGDTLTVLFEYNGKSETIMFTKTNVNVDDFILCD